MILLPGTSGMIGMFGRGSGGNPLTETIDPLDLTFTQVSNIRPFTVMSPNFVWRDIDMASGGSLTDFPGGFGTATVANGTGGINVTSTGANTFKALLASDGPQTPWWATELYVESVGSNPVVAVGIAKDTDNRCLVYYAGGSFGAEMKVAGSYPTGTYGDGPSVTLAAPYKIAAVMTERLIAVFYDKLQGGGWEFGKAWNTRTGGNSPGAGFDFTTVGALDDYKWLAYLGSDSGTGSFSRLRAGMAGEFGISSQYPVINEDGTLIRSGEKYYLCATIAGLDTAPASSIWHPNHIGIFERDPGADTTECVGHILMERAGHYRADAFGPLIRDREVNLWRLVVQNTGTFIDVQNEYTLQYTSSEDLRFGFHILNNPIEMPLGTSGKPAYDTDARKIGASVYYAFTEVQANGDRCQVIKKADDWICTNLVEVGRSAASADIIEGGRITTVGETTWAMWGTNSGFLIYDMDMDFHGYKALSGIGTTHPSHPTWVPIRDGRNTRFEIVTFLVIGAFGGFYNYGPQLVYHSNETLNGWQP